MQLITAMAATLGLTITGGALAQNDSKLAVGDKAPKFDIEHWVIKGKDVKPFKEYEDGKVYVMEFWATWCGPCKTSMPHLTELQKKYQDYDVTIVGVSDESLETVAKWLETEDKKTKQQWSEIIGYTLCTDPDKSVKKEYFEAAGLRGIPSAFIVGKTGEVEWIGHPMSMDEPLDKIVRDTWDRDEHAKAQAREAEAQQLTAKFQQLLMSGAEDPETYVLGRKVVKTYWDNSQVLNQIAWIVVDNPSVKNRNYEFALEIGNRAGELTEWKDGAILDTVARVHHDMGDLKKAIELQRKAVKIAGDDPQMGEGIRKALEQYEQEAKGG